METNNKFEDMSLVINRQKSKILSLEYYDDKNLFKNTEKSIYSVLSRGVWFQVYYQVWLLSRLQLPLKVYGHLSLLCAKIICSLDKKIKFESLSSEPDSGFTSSFELNQFRVVGNLHLF